MNFAGKIKKIELPNLVVQQHYRCRHQARNGIIITNEKAKKIENGTKGYHKTSNDSGQYGIFQYHWTVQSTYCRIEDAYYHRNSFIHSPAKPSRSINALNTSSDL
jgi:hypothetical protein